MSGIFGFTTIATQDNTETIRSLVHWNRFYGGNGFDRVSTDSFGIGCYQDHYTDLFPGSAPVIQRGGDLAVIDAVLYNRDELIGSLGPETPSDISDEELLLTYIEKKGFNMLANINGDFSGAVYRSVTNSWILFRDHSGVRPLFYYRDSNIFAFSSDMRGLLGIPGANLEINEELFYLRMMGHNHLSLCDSEYENIRCVRPASWVEVRLHEHGFTYNEHIYWKWRQQKVRLDSDESYQMQLRHLVTDSLQRRLNAVSGDVGCELSGGMDSSIIAILINRLGRKGHYFSWSYPESDIPHNDVRDERDVIQDICKQENIVCQFDRMKAPESFEDAFERIDPPYINTRHISYGSEYLRNQGARVVFSGHGGDEGVSHRCNLFELWYHREYQAFFQILYKETEGRNLRLLRTAKKAFYQLHEVNAHFRKPFHSACNASKALDSEFNARMKAQISPRSLPFAYDPVAYILQGGHRPRLDNTALQGAQNGVRYMFPFLDYRVLDFALSIPRVQYTNGSINRYIYRKAFDDLMPDSLRKVNYKDMPSREQRIPQVDLYANFHEIKGKILHFLDHSRWEGYLDFDAINNMTIAKKINRTEYILASKVIGELVVCCAIQSAADRCKAWRKLDEQV